MLLKFSIKKLFLYRLAYNSKFHKFMCEKLILLGKRDIS